MGYLLGALVMLGCAGKDGINGADGANGKDGASGKDGVAGASADAGAGSTAVGSDPGQVALPGATWFPESLSAAQDGTLYVGSLGGLGIAKVLPGSDLATPFVAAGTVKAVAGVFVDQKNNLLYACDNDFGTNKAVLRAFDLASASPKASYPFTGSGFCNDMTLDGSGNLFVTDSFGKIYKLAKDAAQLSTWSSDPLLAPSSATGFGADGIAFDGTSTLYVNTFSDSRFLRITVSADGSAGAVSSITSSPALVNPDGMRTFDAKTLLVVEGGHVTKVSIDGATATATPLVSRLDTPTSVVVSNGRFWVTEGQLPVFLKSAPGPANLPFLVRDFPATL